LAHGANLVSQWLETPNQTLAKRRDLFKQTGMPTVIDWNIQLKGMLVATCFQ